MPKGSAAQQAADCSTIRHREMRFTDWVKEGTERHPDYVTFTSFPQLEKNLWPVELKWGGGLMENNVRVAGGTADIETGQLLVI